MQFSLCHTLLTAYPLFHNYCLLLVHMKAFISLILHHSSAVLSIQLRTRCTAKCCVVYLSMRNYQMQCS